MPAVLPVEQATRLDGVVARVYPQGTDKPVRPAPREQRARALRLAHRQRVGATGHD
jgi:hypothetical protein